MTIIKIMEFILDNDFQTHGSTTYPLEPTYYDKLMERDYPSISYFFMSLFIYYCCYKFVDYIMRNNYDYNNLEQDRKNYFLKNIVKTIAMIFIALYGSTLLYQGIRENFWDNKMIYIVGYQYSALDVLGLIMVKKLPINSKIHHISSFVLSVLNTFVDYSKPTFWIGLPIYCLLSCYAFFVNMYLGLRLIVAPKNLKFILDSAYFSYMILLFFNWSFQVKVGYEHISTIGITYDIVLYFCFILFVAYDDIKLIQFLKYHREKKED